MAANVKVEEAFFFWSVFVKYVGHKTWIFSWIIFKFESHFYRDFKLSWWPVDRLSIKVPKQELLKASSSFWAHCHVTAVKFFCCLFGLFARFAFVETKDFMVEVVDLHVFCTRNKLALRVLILKRCMYGAEMGS